MTADIGFYSRRKVNMFQLLRHVVNRFSLLTKFCCFRWNISQASLKKFSASSRPCVCSFCPSEWVILLMVTLITTYRLKTKGTVSNIPAWSQSAIRAAMQIGVIAWFSKYRDGHELRWRYWITGSADKNYNLHSWEELVYLDANTYEFLETIGLIYTMCKPGQGLKSDTRKSTNFKVGSKFCFATTRLNSFWLIWPASVLHCSCDFLSHHHRVFIVE